MSRKKMRDIEKLEIGDYLRPGGMFPSYELVSDIVDKINEIVDRMNLHCHLEDDNEL